MSSTQTQIDQTDSTETTAATTEEIVEVDSVVGDDTSNDETYPVRKAGEIYDGDQEVRSSKRRARPYEDEVATCDFCGEDVDGEDIDSVHAANDDKNAHALRGVPHHCSGYIQSQVAMWN